MNHRSNLMLALFLMYCPALIAMQALKKKQEEIIHAKLTAAYERLNVRFAKENLKERIGINNEIRASLGKRSLIILFSPTDSASHNTAADQPDALEVALCFNLLKPCAPIIIHTSTWLRLICLRNRGTLADKFARALNFNLSDWDIRSSRDKTMMLFIPKDVVINAEQPSITYKTYTYSDAISITGQKDTRLKALNDGELCLGIKINHLPKVDNPFQFPTASMDPCALNMDGSSELAHYLLEMLVTSFDLRQLNIEETALNYWDILLMGHGNSQIVSGMRHSSFSDLLTFLDTDINTRSFFFISCQSGAHLEKPYQFKRKKQTQEKDFNFLILASSVFDLTVSSAMAPASTERYFNHINEYFKAIQQSEKKAKQSAARKEQKLLDAFDSFFIIKLNQTSTEPSILQYPAIRFPHTGWFVIPDVEPYGTFIVNDSRIMRTINKGKKSITIDPRFTTVVIESQYIPIPLIFKGAQMPLLVPRKIKEPIFFKEIRAASCTLATFDQSLKKLTTLGNRSDNKNLIVSNFYIEKLTLKDYQRALICVEPGESFKTSKSNEPTSKFVQNFKNEKEKRRTESKLPESMKSENPQPVIAINPPKESGGKPEIVGTAPQEPE
jgi:hypothetical protein